jgi:hypothetical protein
MDDYSLSPAAAVPSMADAFSIGTGHVKPILDLKQHTASPTSNLTRSELPAAFESTLAQCDAEQEHRQQAMPKTRFTFTASLERRSTITGTPTKKSAESPVVSPLQRTPSLARSRLPVSQSKASTPTASQLGSPTTSTNGEADLDVTKRRLKFIGSSLPTLKYFKSDASSKIPVRPPGVDPSPQSTSTRLYPD